MLNIVSTDYWKLLGLELLAVVLITIFLRIVFIIIVGKLLNLIIVTSKKDKEVFEKRAKTISEVFLALGNFIIYTVAILIVLGLFGINVVPILAGIGLVGLELGFGAQSLIRDFISGIFMLIENQFSLGDMVKIGDLEGRVVKITLRSTVLENKEGFLVYIANGSMNSLINNSQRIDNLKIK